MRLLNRHIASHILGLTAIVALALVAIYSFVSFVSEIDDTGEGNFGVVQLMLYSAMLIPTAIYTLMPIIAMLWGVADGEKIGLLHIGCMGVILVGVYLSRRQ